MLKNGSDIKKIIALRDIFENMKDEFLQLKQNPNEDFKIHINEVCNGYTNPLIVAELLGFRCEIINEYINI